MATDALSSKTTAIKRGLWRALPVMLGYLPLSFACATVTLAAGVAPWATIRLALLAYTGASQLVAVNMLRQNAATLTIILMVFVVNSRLLLMSAVLAPHLQHLARHWRLLFAFGLTDEAFALHASRLQQRVSTVELFTIQIGLHGAWIAGAALATRISLAPAEQLTWGLDYAPLAMLIILWVLLVDRIKDIAVTIFAGLLATGLHYCGLVGWDILIAASLGAGLGLIGAQKPAKAFKK